MFATFTDVTRRSEMPLAQGTPGGTPAHARQRARAEHPPDRAPFLSDNPEDAWLAPHVAPEGARELLKRALRVRTSALRTHLGVIFEAVTLPGGRNVSD